jgi:3-deoxy-D-arabino-heptulosonate 7-phosphate (DAHP) synthase
MLSIHTRIDRAQRLVEMLESDAPRLAMRVAPLSPEHQKAAKLYAAQLASHARAELQRLIAEGSLWDADATPQAAD